MIKEVFVSVSAQSTYSTLHIPIDANFEAMASCLPTVTATLCTCVSQGFSQAQAQTGQSWNPRYT